MFKNRHTYLGGSDISAILSISPFKSALDLYHEKVNKENIENSSQLMYWGNQLEPVILQQYASNCHELDFIYYQEEVTHLTYPFLKGHLDAYNESTNTVIDAKNISFKSKDWENGIPAYYQTQLAFYCGLKQSNHAIAAVLFNGNNYQEFEYFPTNDYINFIEEEAVKFWERIQHKNPPSPQTATDIYKYVKVIEKSTLEADEEMLECLLQLKDLQYKEVNLKKQIDIIKSKVILTMGENESLMYGDYVLASFKNRVTNRFDSKKFKAENESLYQDFTVSTNSRYFLTPKGGIL